MRAPTDRHYTPLHIAATIADVLSFARASPIKVADFAAGRGTLLEAVEKRYSNASCFATDIDDATLKFLAFTRPTWQVGRCDFTSQRSIAQSSILGSSKSFLDAVVLNPPFSCRGAQTLRSKVAGRELRSGIALAFVLRSLERLRKNGEVAALLPAGTLTSEKDDQGWQLLNRLGKVCVVDEFGRTEFPGAHAKTVLVHLRLREGEIEPEERRAELMTRAATNRRPLTLHRGRAPVRVAVEGRSGPRFLHTTDIRDGSVAFQSVRRAPGRLAIHGPLLLIPRVGRPDMRKVALTTRDLAIVLSDCLFAVDGSVGDLQALRRAIRRNWSRVERAYTGSCAPYLTIRHLLAVFRELGFTVDLEERLQRLAN